MGNTSKFVRDAERQYCAYAPVDPFSGSRNCMHPLIFNIDVASSGMAGAMKVC